MTDNDNTPIRLLAVSGSLRSGSFCTTVLKSLQTGLPDGVEFDIFPLNDIPLYNQDIDSDEQRPAAVNDFKQAIADCDGLVVISPEYNYGISGVLKNAIDWASRPAMNSVLKGKPALVMTASPAATGGVRAQSQVREVLAACLARVVARPQVVIAAVKDKVSDGRLTDEAALSFSLAAIDDLIAEVRLLRRAA